MERMYEYCAANNIPYKQVGKLIVALNSRECEELDALYSRGLANGVQGLKLLSKQELQQLEPNVNGIRALYSAKTGIVSFQRVAESFAREIQQNGGDIITGFEVMKCEPAGSTNYYYCDGHSSTHHHIISSSVTQNIVKGRKVLVCGGIYSDRLARIFGGSPYPQLVSFRGTYLEVSASHSNLVSHNIYPVPDRQFPFLGIHITPCLNTGKLIIGPNAAFAFARQGYRFSDFNLADFIESISHRGFRSMMRKHWRFGLEQYLEELFPRLFAMRAIQQYVPSFKYEYIDGWRSGVRAQAIDHTGKLIEDFVLEAQGNSILHVRNAPSPAATSSLMIAERVVDRAQQLFKLN